MDLSSGKIAQIKCRRSTQWRFGENGFFVILFISFLTLQCNCQTIFKDESHINEITTKRHIDKNLDNVDTNECHSCHSSSSKIKTKNLEESDNIVEDFLVTIGTFTEEYLLVNKTENELESEIETALDEVLKKDRYEIVEGIEIRTADKMQKKVKIQEKSDSDLNSEGKALFSSYTYEYRLAQKIKEFFETHVLSINLPKAAEVFGFRSFGLKKFFLPLLIGAQVFKSILLAMFLPSILGSFGKILGKGLSTLSASSSQASYPPANSDDHISYNTDQKDVMGYETNQAGTYVYPQDGMFVNMADPNDEDLSNVDMSRFGDQKVSYLPSKNGYYKNQIASASNSYKVFQKIPASSMILSNYDPFYSPLLSRLDGIFARMGLVPSENAVDNGAQVGGQTLSDVKLEACREQLICLMYATPAKYAPYSNLVSAQLSRELNELRRPVSDNPEILRFFRYMRAARRGQEGVDCLRAHAACAASTPPTHTMISAYHDINKLVTARKIQ